MTDGESKMANPTEDGKFEHKKWDDERAFREREVLVKEAELSLKRQEQAASQWRSPLVVAVLAAALAAAGNAAVSFLNGKFQRELEAQKSEQARILEMIKTGDPDRAAENLGFLVNVGLIADSKLQDRINDVLTTRKPGSGPTLPSTLSGGVVLPSTPETVGFTDFDVFLCDAEWDKRPAQTTAEAVIAALKTAGHVGQIRLKQWKSYDEVPLKGLRDKLTIIFDAGRGEAREVPRLKKHFKEVGGLPVIQALENTGKSSPWLISIVVCPPL